MRRTLSQKDSSSADPRFSDQEQSVGIGELYKRGNKKNTDWLMIRVVSVTTMAVRIERWSTFEKSSVEDRFGDSYL